MSTESPELLYLDLMRNCLTRYIFGERWCLVSPPKSGWEAILFPPIEKLFRSFGLYLVRPFSFKPSVRAEGRDWPPEAETMIGLKRLDNLQNCITAVLRNKVPGDLIETGVWRGGAVIFMRAVLKAHGDTQRIVWAADSFQGLPKPDEKLYPADTGDRLWTSRTLAVSLEEVKNNFIQYGLLDDQVRFLPGWFRDTLPSAPIKQLAILRLDGDLYESTMVALEALYCKLSLGGYVIVDDYGVLPTARLAVDDFRKKLGIAEELQWADWSCVFWQRTK